jgi:hypothetical protein
MTMCGVGKRPVMGTGGGTCADKLIVVVATEARPDRAAQNTRDISPITQTRFYSDFN